MLECQSNKSHYPLIVSERAWLDIRNDFTNISGYLQRTNAISNENEVVKRIPANYPMSNQKYADIILLIQCP